MQKKRNPKLISEAVAPTTNESFHDTLPKTKPPPDSLFWKLVAAPESLQISNDAYATDFVQGIRKGTLDPSIYGGFNISDCFYCYSGADDYEDAAKRAAHPELKAYLQEKADSYKEYNNSFTTTWRITGPEAIIPTKEAKEYSEWETNIAKNEEPFYTLIAMLPCTHLWAWLAQKLTDDPVSGLDPVKNVYAFWIKDNLSFGGSHRIGNFIDTFMKEHPGEIDEAKAMRIYTEGMKHEQANFASP